ncbi:hypothetical protein BGW39_008280 [Mortierella sp. 14UC]|nr:hypothetical protein BGW39_008280 [Mortierella sp. 14UC]
MSTITAASPRARSMMRSAPIYMLMFLSALINLMTTALAAPVRDNGDALDKARAGPYNLSVQAGIAGAILIITGLILCFFGIRFFRVCMFLIGFYFFGNISYIGMANGGVTSETLLLIVSIVVGILGGLLLVCCSRLGVAILGALALYSLGLWILGWKSGGVITSSVGRGIFLGVLVILGFILGFIREHETVIIGSAILGAYAFVAGVDLYARTGFIQQTDSFINSKSNLDRRVGNVSGEQIALLVTFIVLAIIDANMSLQQAAAVPAYRHHRRSVNRVLPPALEVRLARLSIDEGESRSAHIVPAPPSLPLRIGMPDFDREYNRAGSQDSLSSSASSNNNNDGFESIVEGTPSTYTNTNRLGKLGTSPNKGTGHPHRRHHHHRRSRPSSSSMLNPQAPSALFQIDQQHQQNYHQPNITVQYHRRNRSGSQLLGDSQGNNRTTDTGGGGGSPFISVPLFTGKLQQKEQGGIGAAAAATVSSDSPMMMDTADFGEDLFHWNSLELDNGFADSPTIARLHPHRQTGIYKCDGSMNEPDSSLQVCTSTYHTPPTMQSPSRKGPLSAASSQTPSRSSSPLSGCRSPLGELSENAVRMGDQLFGSAQAEARSLRIDTLNNNSGGGDDSYLDVPEMDEGRMPPGLPMLMGSMSNEQDRWKSPTLSALASRSSSRDPSPRALSPSPLSQRSAIVMAMPSHNSNLDQEYVSELAEVDDMRVEIPMIETRDEIPLQDIWRMEDEERKDRLNGAERETAGGGSIEEHIANMKGEQHAHEEARLIHEAIDAHSHEALLIDQPRTQ